MIYYLLVVTSTALFCLGLILLKKDFFVFATSSANQLDTILNGDIGESAKQSLLIKRLIKLLSSLLILVVKLGLVTLISLIPIYLFTKMNNIPQDNLDVSSYKFILSMIFGSGVLFIRFSKKKDYSYWSILLHKLVLDNYNIGKQLFLFDRKSNKEKTGNRNENFVVITGLARGGTTALTNLFFDTGNFHSLSYANMPFLMGINLWRRFYNPKKTRLKQRAHGDNVMFGYNTIEALEEYFFKAHLDDGFIQNHHLIRHEISEKIYNRYIDYQTLVKEDKNQDSTYIAKNNNLIIRYESLRKHNPQFYIVLIFRDPIDHAYSLLKQHRKFHQKQKEDPFTLDYMNWLAHHEFGIGHKPFLLENNSLLDKYDQDSINYWVANWINYYSYVLSLPKDENLILIDYLDLLNNPKDLVESLSKYLNHNFDTKKIKSFSKSASDLRLEVDEELRLLGYDIYSKLADKKLLVE